MNMKLNDTPSWQQVNALLESMQRDYAEIGPRDFLAIALLATTGVRASELLSLQKQDVRPADGTIIIKQLKRGGPVHREVLIVPELRKLLEQYIKNFDPDDRIFPITRQHLLNLVHEYTQRYLGKKFRTHAFRHAFATRILSQTRDVALCKRLLGHANVNTTMVYLNFTARDRAAEIYSALKAGDGNNA